MNGRKARWTEYARLTARQVLHPRRRAVAVTPVAKDNPYQHLIYSAWQRPAVGVAPETAAKLMRGGGIGGVHLHWDEFLFPFARPEATRRSAAALSEIRARGGRIAFTAHNAVPHADLDNPEAIDHFRQWRRHVLDLSDVVHVHSRTARDMILSEYDIAPARLHVIPHPSYAGVFTPLARPDTPGTRRRFLGFGDVRRSRGTPNLIEAFRRLDVPGRDLELHLAGRGTEMFAGTALGRTRLIVSPGFVADADIPRLHAEAEFCVFGFDSALTSGSMMLALTLGKPVIIPEFPSLMEVFEGGPAPLGYTPGDRAALAAVLARAAAMTAEEIAARSAESLQIAKRHDPATISRKLERVVCGEERPVLPEEARDRIA